MKRNFCIFTFLLGVLLMPLCGRPQQTHPNTSSGISELGVLRIQELKIPRKLIDMRLDEKYTRATFLKSSIYVEIKKNGTFMWRSPSQKIDANGTQERFLFPLDAIENAAPFFHASKDEFVCTVYMAESEALTRASGAAAGGLGGALLGAATGAAIGFWGGGFGAIPGAIVGGITGFTAGSSAGGLPPVDNAREIATFTIPNETLFSEHTSDLKQSGDLLTEGLTAKLKLAGIAHLPAMREGELQLQRLYTVRLRSIFLSKTNEKVVDNGKYYAVISQTGNEDVKVDLGSIPVNITFPLEKLILFKNYGGESRIRVFRDKWGKDPVVFEGYQAPTDGKRWVFMGEIRGSEINMPSIMTFETFDAEVVK